MRAAVTAALLLPPHGDRMDLVYFWSSIVIVLLPVAVFVAIGFLAWRGYRRRRRADGGWPP